MTGFVGMDVEAVQQVAVQLDQRSTQLRELAHALDSMVAQLQAEWHGHDATTFSGWWQQQHRPALMACVEAVHGLAQSARTNAGEQAGVSGGGTAGGAHSGIGPGEPPGGPTGPQPGGPANPAGVWQAGRDKINDVQAGYDTWSHEQVPTRWSGWADPNQSQYQCVAWVHYRSSELGQNLDGVTGNGWELADHVAQHFNEPVTDQPSLHAVASYSDGAYGHVMVVEEVRPDGSFRVSEMNTDNSNGVAATPQEFKDTDWITKGADGSWHKGPDGMPNPPKVPPLRFAAIPS